MSWLGILVATLAIASSALGDRLAAPGAEAGEATAVVALPDPEAGEYSHPHIDVLENGVVDCEGLAFKGSMPALVKQVTFTSVAIGPCTFLGMSAQVTTTSCHVVISGEGIGMLRNAGADACEFHIAVSGCAVEFGAGPFLLLGFHNDRGHGRITALTEAISAAATTTGAACPSPTADTVASFEGYLRFEGSREGRRVPIGVRF